VLISNLRFSAAQGLIPLLEAINRKQKSLIIIADEVEGELLQLLVTNHMRGTLRCCAIKAPAFGEQRLDILNDIATITGGKLITSGDRFDTADKADALIRANVFGSCKKLVVDKLKTTFIGAMGSREEIEKRADLIRIQLSDPTIDAPVKAILKDRLSKLASGVAILRVGGSTESELKERKYRVEDALNATQAAVAEGIVPGGGVALIKASQVLNNDDFANDMSLTQAEKLGVKLVLDACHAPLRRIVENAAATPAVIVENEVKKNSSPTFGYDASHDAYVDVLQAGIIDPVRVTRSALENASSISGLLLCVNALVLDTVERSAISSRS